MTSLGLKTTPLPAASAGPSLREGMFSGKFHGVIAATTPTGARRVITRLPSPVGRVTPAVRIASPA